MPTFSLITTCKGRLHHLKQTLPLMVAQGADEVVVVDYDCPDHAGDWVEANYPQVRVLRLTELPLFCTPHARNAGAGYSQSDWLVFIDGDILLADGWVDWLRGHIEPGHFYRAAPVNGHRDPETFGTIACSRLDYDAVGGYDDAFRGWGGDDDDFYQRLKARRVVQEDYPAHFVQPIRHGDDERVMLPDVNSKDRQIAMNRCYRAAKAQAAALLNLNGFLDLNTRMLLMEQTRQAIAAWSSDRPGALASIKYALGARPRRSLPAPFVMRTQLEFTIHIEPRLPAQPGP